MPNIDAREILGIPSYSGLSGFSGGGASGYSGYSGFSGPSGFSSPSGYSGYSGNAGGATGDSGFSGFSGPSGVSGEAGPAGGLSGYSGPSGYSGISGYSGPSGFSGYSGIAFGYYSTTFDATASWSDMTTYYKIDFTHNLGSQKLIVQVWDETVSPGYSGYDPIPQPTYYESQTIPKPYQLVKRGANELRLQVNQTPGTSGRFAGRIVITSIP